MSEVLTVDGLTFDVRRSDRRKSLEIIVDRGGELRMAVPEGCATEAMAEFAREKRFWILTKLAEKESLRQPIGTKEFVAGEGFPYLGRSHRLRLVEGQEVPLKLSRGCFCLDRSQAAEGRQHFLDWYRDRGRRWLEPRVVSWALRMDVTPTRIEVADLGYRWGSCGEQGRISFHWATILLPPSIVTYVIVHELAHLTERNHTPAFWALVERALPDYERRKRWLAEHGGAMVVL